LKTDELIAVGKKRELTALDFTGYTEVLYNSMIKLGTNDFDIHINGGLANWFATKPFGLDPSKIKWESKVELKVDSAFNVKGVSVGGAIKFSDIFTLKPLATFKDAKFDSFSLLLEKKF